MRWKLTLPLPEFVCRGINYLDAPNILLLCYKTGAKRYISIHGAAAQRSTTIWTVPSVTHLNSWRAACTQADLSIGSSSPRLFLLIYRLTPRWRSRVSREKATWSPEQAHACHHFLICLGFFRFSLGLSGERASPWPSDWEDQQRL